MKTNSGQAFPFVTDDDKQEHLTVQWGLTRREWYAGMALNGYLATYQNGGTDDISMGRYDIAKCMFELADAMIEQSDK